MYLVMSALRANMSNTRPGVDNNLRPVLQLFQVLLDVRVSDARVTGHLHKVAQSQNDFLDLLGQLSGRG